MIKSPSPRIVMLDIETSPIIGYSWTAFDANLLKIIEPSKVISMAWKFLGEKDVRVKSIADYKGYKKGPVNDEALIRDIWKVLDEADVVIGHNSDSFDLKRLNTRFVVYGLNAPSIYQTVDTLKLAKRCFKFDSNSLNNLSQFLGLGEKLANGGFSLWERCLNGDEKAWDTMKAYNVQDVILLEKVYLALRPFQEGHPNLNLIGDEVHDATSCPTCLSSNLSKRGFALTKTGRKQRYQCNTCGSWSSGPWIKTKDVLS